MDICIFTLKLELLFVFPLIIHVVLCQHELVITPDVSIYDEKPSNDTGRIKTFPNKTVIVEALMGESVIFICNIFNMIPNARVIWRRVSFDGMVTETINDGLMSRDMSRWKIGQGKQTNSIRLEILVVDESYAGHYTCDCQYTGSVEPARAERILRVVSQAKVLPFYSSYTTTVTEGDRMTLRCQGAGIPQPVVYWSRTGGSSSLIRNYGISKPGETIDFLSVLPEDAGEYMCMVENRLGIDYWPVRVAVRHKPKIRIYVTAPIAQSPCNVHLYCEVSANPPSEATEIIWSVGSTPTTIVSTYRSRLVYLNGGNTRFLVVAFNPITAADLNQKYTCLAYNTLGTVSLEYVLNASAWMTEGTFADLRCVGSGPRNNLLIMNTIFSLIVKQILDVCN